MLLYQYSFRTGFCNTSKSAIEMCLAVSVWVHLFDGIGALSQYCCNFDLLKDFIDKEKHLPLPSLLLFSRLSLPFHSLAFFCLSWPHTLYPSHISIFAAFPYISSLPALHTSVHHSFLSYPSHSALSSRLFPSLSHSFTPFYPCSAPVRSLPPLLLSALPLSLY